MPLHKKNNDSTKSLFHLTVEKGCDCKDSNIQSQYFGKENERKIKAGINKWLKDVEVATQYSPVIDDVDEINRSQTSPILVNYTAETALLLSVENIVIEEVLLDEEEVIGNILQTEVSSKDNDETGVEINSKQISGSEFITDVSKNNPDCAKTNSADYDSSYDCSGENKDSDFFPSDEDEGIDKENSSNENVNIETNDLVSSNRISSAFEGEETSDHENDNSVIFIRTSKKNQYGERIRRKAHCCYFCNKLYNDLSKHFIKKHASEGEVVKLLLMDKKSIDRRNGFIHLTRAGDYYHNCEVLIKKSGELILARLPTPTEKSIHAVNDYSPCPNCLGFMLKRHLWHHVKYGCTLTRNTNQLRRQIISESTALLVHTFSNIVVSEEFSNNIIIPLKNDIISMTCKQDNLIMKFGAMQFEKYHTTQNELIRQSMRQLGRLLIELRKINTKIAFLSDWLIPKYFDHIVTAVRNICHATFSTKTRPKFDIPSLALKLGYSLRKCISIQKGVCLRKEDLNTVKTLNALLSIMDLEWSIKISSSALASLNNRKMNATALLPLTEDLIKFNCYLNKNLEVAKANLNEEINFTNWYRFATLVLTKIIIFNKRRSGEASRMTVHQYTTRPNWSDVCNAEFKNSLSSFEKELASKLTIVQIGGKRDKIVNVLLTKEMKDSVDLLLLHRNKFVNSDNPYIFARSNPSIECIRGYECLKNLAHDAKLIRPEVINATTLRKYVATVCQIFNLTENETDWLARHLGHDIRVHREFYRLHDSSVELTKVSRILLAIEGGKAHEFSGKKLSEINICGKLTM